MPNDDFPGADLDRYLEEGFDAGLEGDQHISLYCLKGICSECRGDDCDCICHDQEGR